MPGPRIRSLNWVPGVSLQLYSTIRCGKALAYLSYDEDLSNRLRDEKSEVKRARAGPAKVGSVSHECLQWIPTVDFTTHPRGLGCSQVPDATRKSRIVVETRRIELPTIRIVNGFTATRKRIIREVTANNRKQPQTTEGRGRAIRTQAADCQDR